MRSLEVRVNCPYCEKNGKTPDRKRHLYLNTWKKAFICFRCGEKGRFTNMDSLLLYANNISNTYDSLRTRLNRFSPIFTPIDIDSFSVPVTTKTLAYKYLVSRGVTQEEITQYQFRIGINEEWGGRILIPFFRNGVCVYLVGRTYTHQTPKYKNYKVPKNNILFNFENIKDECIICEGVFSALTAQRVSKKSAIALLGKYISTTQANLIASKCAKVWLALDGDVESEERAMVAKTLYSAGVNEVLDIKIPKEEDPDSLKKKFYIYFQAATLQPKESKICIV